MNVDADFRSIQDTVAMLHADSLDAPAGPPPFHLKPLDAVRELLLSIGEDPDRNGLIDTPDRVVRALLEMTSGYTMDPGALLCTQFDVTYDEMVVVRDIEFTSLCEHHMLPFVGTAVVAYLPSKGIVGLSKIARLVEGYARRLQVQERMTQQIARALDTHLQPKGVGVVVSAEHSCMAARGVRKRSEMVTSCLLGALRDDERARSEFLALAKER